MKLSTLIAKYRQPRNKRAQLEAQREIDGLTDRMLDQSILEAEAQHTSLRDDLEMLWAEREYRVGCTGLTSPEETEV